MKTDVQISSEANLEVIQKVADKLGIPDNAVLRYGRYKGKVDYKYITDLANKNTTDAKLVLVTAISPTPAGEGKTTTTVGLGDALNLIGEKAIVCLREPSLGPCFGVKGGGTGGGYAQVVPMDEINLHFTGDFHAITSAHNLLSALIDNHIQWGNSLNIDTRRITWKRVLDMNDRTLRHVISGMGGTANGTPRETGFDITVASEIMAIFCLANSLEDLAERIDNITVAYSVGNQPIYCKDLEATGAMMALLRDAFAPNLVQTLENNPAFVHGGPFANIAHGCNSVIATKAAMKLADFVVTEAGFGADLGAEKFCDIKCRKSGLAPDAIVLVATVRALKMHGGIAKSNLTTPNPEAVRDGAENLGRHIRNLSNFGVSVTVAINEFISDTKEEMDEIIKYCEKFNVKVFSCSHWANGGAGAENLAKYITEVARSDYSQFRLLYDDEMPLLDKMRYLARTFYGAEDIIADKKIREKFQHLQDNGWGNLPICVAKTQYSFSTDPQLMGAPTGHMVPIRDVILSSGAGFLVVICGAVMTMPGLPRVPSANSIGLDENSQIIGLF